MASASARFTLLLVVLVPTLPARAQQPAAGTGTVTGHVICADTQRPARFAQVTLFGVPAEVTQRPKLDPNADEATQMAAMKDAMASMKKTNIATALTDLNGAYTATDLAPGDYYLFGSTAGYISPLNTVQAALAAGADPKKPLAGIPIVHVVADRSSVGDVTITRGAAVSGTVLWDDGTPVTQAHVAVVAAQAEPKEPPTQFAMLAIGGGLMSLLAITDDQGHFRLAGLAPGDYLVSATLQANTGLNMTGGSMNFSHIMSQKPIVVYAPAAFHKTAAKSFTLHGSDTITDLIVTINLGGTHNVSGRIGSAEDHHSLNSATVTLTDAADKEFLRSASVDAAGNYTITFVPSATYNLTVTDAADTEPEKKSDKKASILNFSSDKTVRSYEDGKQSLIVSESDIAGLSIELTPSKKVKKGIDINSLIEP
jgi:hypothetical protein